MLDCLDPINQANQGLGSCDREANTAKMPLFAVVVPPEVEINPYTGQPMQP